MMTSSGNFGCFWGMYSDEHDDEHVGWVSGGGTVRTGWSYKNDAARSGRGVVLKFAVRSSVNHQKARNSPAT